MMENGAFMSVIVIIHAIITRFISYKSLVFLGFSSLLLGFRIGMGTIIGIRLSSLVVVISLTWLVMVTFPFFLHLGLGGMVALY